MQGASRCVLALFFGMRLCLLAQSTSPPVDDRQTVASLRQQLQTLQSMAKVLQDRLDALQQNQAAAAPAAAAAMPTAQAETPSALPASLHDFQGIHWKGFGEVDYQVLNQRIPELGSYGFVPGSAGNFYSGDFALFLSSQLTNRTSVLAEIALEETDAQNYKSDLRRILLKYDLNDRLRTSFGRFQTAIGYYNWAFRSAAWLQTTADRPLVMEYASNGGILPTQGIGLEATGAIFSPKLGLNYIAQYGSADTIRPDLTGDGNITDENNGNYFNVGLFARPDRFPGLQVGTSYYHDQISDLPAQAIQRYGQTIVNAYAVENEQGLEFITEGFLVRHELIGSPVAYDTSAFYSQISKRWWRVRPFFRYQYTNAGRTNPIFSDVGLRHGPSFGLRYDIDNYFAFKAQLDHTMRRDLPDLSGLHLQLAFTF